MKLANVKAQIRENGKGNSLAVLADGSLLPILTVCSVTERVRLKTDSGKVIRVSVRDILAVV